MNAEFFALALTAALNPKLLALDLLLIENRRPRAMFLCLLAGGLSVALTIGLLDVLAIHADAITAQGKVSAGVDLAIGLLLVAVGALVATGRLRGMSPLEEDARTAGRSAFLRCKDTNNRITLRGPGWARRVREEPR